MKLREGVTSIDQIFLGVGSDETSLDLASSRPLRTGQGRDNDHTTNIWYVQGGRGYQRYWSSQGAVRCRRRYRFQLQVDKVRQ